VPSTPKHQSKNCNVDLLNKTSATLAALQQLSEECGLDDVAVKAHIAPVRSSMPYQPWVQHPTCPSPDSQCCVWCDSGVGDELTPPFHHARPIPQR
jgi:hypothetical protein